MKKTSTSSLLALGITVLSGCTEPRSENQDQLGSLTAPTIVEQSQDTDVQDVNAKEPVYCEYIEGIRHQVCSILESGETVPSTISMMAREAYQCALLGEADRFLITYNMYSTEFYDQHNRIVEIPGAQPDEIIEFIVANAEEDYSSYGLIVSRNSYQSQHTFLVDDGLDGRADTDSMILDENGIVQLTPEEVNKLYLSTLVQFLTYCDAEPRFPENEITENDEIEGQHIHRRLNTGRMSSRELFELLQNINGLESIQDPIISENSEDPIIILLEDQHNFTQARRGVQLEILRRRFGINSVGVEGWAGREVDEERGIINLNASQELIQDLLSNSNFNVIALENATFQEYVWMQAAISDQRYTLTFRDIEQIQECIESRDYYLKKLGLSSSVENINLVIQNVANLLEYPIDIEDYTVKDLDALIDGLSKLIVDGRSIIGVQHLINDMRINDRRVSAMVFGEGHTASIIDSLTIETGGNFSLYIIPLQASGRQ